MSPRQATCVRQQCIDSAKPCNSKTSGAPDVPAVMASKARCGAMVICSDVGMGAILDGQSGQSVVGHISAGVGGIVQPGKSAVLEAAERPEGRTFALSEVYSIRRG